MNYLIGVTGGVVLSSCGLAISLKARVAAERVMPIVVHKFPVWKDAPVMVPEMKRARVPKTTETAKVKSIAASSFHPNLFFNRVTKGTPRKPAKIESI
jgi:hypothetical protein